MEIINCEDIANEQERLVYMNKKEILNLIEEEDVEFIRLQFADAFGNMKNIAVTPGQFERVIDDRYPFDSAALFDDYFRVEEDLYLCPDLDTFVVLPWRPQQGKVGKFVCDVCHKDGSAYEMSPRTILKKVLDRAKEEGYTFLVDPECEFFLFHTDDNGKPTTITHEKAGYLDVGPMDYGENARRDMVLMLEEMGFEIEESHHEKAPAQHEIDFAQGEAMETADALMTFKFAIRSIARRFGLYATFMPKPRTDAAGSGMHLNISVYKDGKNLFDADSDNEIAECAKNFMGGIMEHVESMCAITNPIVNSYKRILSGYEAPYRIDWSTRGENSLLKYHKCFGESKIELRFPDPSANPYLAIAVCVAAGLDGIHKKAQPGPQDDNSKDVLPGNLKDAVALLKQDDLMKEVLGEEFINIYAEVKNAEWHEYMKQVSDWEVERYLVKM